MEQIKIENTELNVEGVLENSGCEYLFMSHNHVQIWKWL